MGRPMRSIPRTTRTARRTAASAQRVTLRELIDHMITRSSNLATNALIALAGAKNANATAHELGAQNIKVLRGVEDSKAFQRRA